MIALSRNMLRSVGWFVAAGFLGASAAAGDLDPPAGAVAPTMKTLEEVEPRVPIHAADMPLTISQPGSYYFTENISTSGDGITINAGDVTIDLMGFELQGGTGAGISLGAGLERVVIQNGGITLWPEYGIDASNALACVFRNLRTMRNGFDGLLLGQQAIVEGCISSFNAQNGFSSGDQAVIVDCLAHQNGAGGFELGSELIVRRCVSTWNAGIGFSGSDHVKFSECEASNNADLGFDLAAAGEITGCLSSGNGAGIQAMTGVVRQCKVWQIPLPGVGIWVGGQGAVLDCAVEQGGTGIEVEWSTLVERNDVRRSGYGVRVNNSQCVVRNNTLIENDLGISIAPWVAGGVTVSDNIVHSSLTDNYDIPVFGPGQVYQLEILLCEIPETIEWPCTVTLAGSLESSTTGIHVTVEAHPGVTIDLGGHALLGDGPGSTVAIDVDAWHVTIRNGLIADWGTGAIDASAAGFCVIEDLVVNANGIGATDPAVLLGRGTIIRDSVIQTNAGDGIVCLLDDNTIERCTVDGNLARGVVVASNCVVRDCAVRANTTAGILAQDSCQILGCEVVSNGENGIVINQYCRVMNNRCFDNGWSGIVANGVSSLLQGNLVHFNGIYGIDLVGSLNVVMCNCAMGNTSGDYNTGGGNDVGPIGPASTSTSPWANIQY